MNETVFVNRILNMKKIKYIGLDMDHTLIRYQTQNFEKLVYQYAIDALISSKKYPDFLKKLEFNFDQAIRGLVIDTKNGNILKVSRYGAIRQSTHGTKQMGFSEQKKFYRSTYVDLNDPNYMVIDTSFSISFCVLYAQLVDLKDEHPKLLPRYDVMAQDVLVAVDSVHAQGDMKKEIAKNLDHYIIKDEELIKGIQLYLSHGKKIFIITNSDFYYTQLLLDYAITPFLEKGEHWLNLFDYVITLADKPRFFYDNLRFLHINLDNGAMTNLAGPITPGIYQGGNATKFTQDLGLAGDEILYVGDHIYGDVLRLKKHCNWRTALVLDELGAERDGQRKALPIEKEIKVMMEIKGQLEEKNIELYTKSITEQSKQYERSLEILHDQLTEVDNKITILLQKQHEFFNPNWDRVFRVGAEESYFAYQVERYACIYMERLSDLFLHSPYTYFRSRRRLLAHDMHID